jgi:hypothetical protein
VLWAASLALAPAARAQYSIPWYTIDGGGGESSGGGFTLSGSIGQPDAATSSGGALALSGGYWATAGAPACYANCDASTTAPVLNVLDFNCFVNRFAAGDSYGNCDGGTTPPVLNILDFNCFLNRFAAGCP